MGNTNIDSKNNSQINNKQLIPFNYYQHCHPNIMNLNIDSAEKQYLSSIIRQNNKILNWLSRVQLLLSSKCLFTPLKIISQLQSIIKSIIKSYYEQFKIEIFYQPFIFTLSSQIVKRKQKNRFFTQKQLWKLIRYLTKGLIEWHQHYKLQRICWIMPQNIVLNKRGHIRIVCRYSFPIKSYHNRPNHFYQQQSTLLNIQQVNRFKILSDDLYTIGMTVLDCLLLQTKQDNQFQNAQHKLRVMHQNQSMDYTYQLRQVITILLNKDYKKRPNPHDLVEFISAHNPKIT